MKPRYRILADGRAKPIAPDVVQYELRDGTLLDYAPDQVTHPDPSWIGTPRSLPFTRIVHDLDAYERLDRAGYFREREEGVTDERRAPR